MFIGEVARLDATVRYASPHSMEVLVTVMAENVATGEVRTTNRATGVATVVQSPQSGADVQYGTTVNMTPARRLAGTPVSRIPTAWTANLPGWPVRGVKPTQVGITPCKNTIPPTGHPDERAAP